MSDPPVVRSARARRTVPPVPDLLPAPPPARLEAPIPVCVLSPDPVTTPGCPIPGGRVRGGARRAKPCTALALRWPCAGPALALLALRWHCAGPALTCEARKGRAAAQAGSDLRKSD
eukprot:6360456-Prymnesium_polylepis.1